MHLLSTLLVVAGLSTVSICQSPSNGGDLVHHDQLLTVPAQSNYFQCQSGSGYCCTQQVKKHGYGNDCSPVPVIKLLDGSWQGHVCAPSHLSRREREVFGKTPYHHAACCIELPEDERYKGIILKKCHKPEYGTYKMPHPIPIPVIGGGKNAIDATDPHSIVPLDTTTAVKGPAPSNDKSSALDGLLDLVPEHALSPFAANGDDADANQYYPATHYGVAVAFNYSAKFECQDHVGWCCDQLGSNGLGINCTIAPVVRPFDEADAEPQYICQDDEEFHTAPACCTIMSNNDVPGITMRSCPTAAFFSLDDSSENIWVEGPGDDDEDDNDEDDDDWVSYWAETKYAKPIDIWKTSTHVRSVQEGEGCGCNYWCLMNTFGSINGQEMVDVCEGESKDKECGCDEKCLVPKYGEFQGMRIAFECMVEEMEEAGEIPVDENDKEEKAEWRSCMQDRYDSGWKFSDAFMVCMMQMAETYGR